MDIAKYVMIVGWIFVLIWIPFVIYTNRKIHPKALFVLFFTEMWERFSYYGMRALLTLYMVKVLFAEMLQAHADKKALAIYGSYTAMVYLFPVIGGIVADRIMGFRKTVVLGGTLMMLGHFSLALEGLFFEGNMNLFFLSLSLIIIGNAYFKPNISSFLGTFYKRDDPGKDGAFTIFYMGVNIGAFLATLTCGYVGEEISWHYGFGLAGIGMLIGIIIFVTFGKQVFGQKGLYPASLTDVDDVIARRKNKKRSWAVIIATLFAIPLCAALLDLNKLMTTLLLILSLVTIAFLIYSALTSEDRVAGQRLAVIVVLFFFHSIFWALFEQAGGSLTLFTERNVDRSFLGGEIPASIFQSLNPFYIMLLAPLFSWMWIRLSRRGKEPVTPVKFVLGLLQLALGYVVIIIGARFFSVEGYVPVIFLFLLYLFHTTGELCLSPVGLSMITKLSPAKIVGFVMGAWFLSIALANKMAGFIGELTASESITKEAPAAETLTVYTDTYLIWGVYVVLGFAILLMLLVPTLRKWMHGIH